MSEDPISVEPERDVDAELSPHPIDEPERIAWLRRVSRGLWFNTVGYALFGLMSTPQAQSTIGRAGTESAVNVQAWLVFLGVVGCGAIGTWLLTTPEPAESSASRFTLLRVLLRVGAIVEAGAVLYQQIRSAILHKVDPEFGLHWLGFSELNLSLGVTIMWWVYLGGLQRKIGNRNLATASQCVAIGLVAARVAGYWVPWALLPFGSMDWEIDLGSSRVTLYAELAFVLAAAVVTAMTARAVSQLAAAGVQETGQNQDGGSSSQETGSPVRG